MFLHSKFEGKDELKEHWDIGEIFCKTCQKYCITPVRKGTEDVYPDDEECESHDWSVIKNKCGECFLFFFVFFL